MVLVVPLLDPSETTRKSTSSDSSDEQGGRCWRSELRARRIETSATHTSHFESNCQN